MIRSLALFSAALAVPATSFAQVAPVATAPAMPAMQAVIAAPAQEAVIRSGTPVPLKMREELTTKGKKLRVGQRFNLETAENMTLNGVTVVPAGTPAMGEITEVRNKGMWGKSGHITARVLSMRVGDRQIRLSGSLDDKGVTGTGGVVAAALFIPVAGFFTTGTSAAIPLGAPVNAFLDEDVPVAFAPAAAPLPVVVPVVQPGTAVLTNAVATVPQPK